MRFFTKLAAGTEKDIQDNLRPYQQYLKALGEALGDARARRQEGTDFMLRRMTNRTWVILINKGYLIAEGILGTREIPPSKAKAFELAYRLFATSRKMPQDIIKWWDKNVSRLNLILEAVDWNVKEIGTGLFFAQGPFQVHNTIGASGSELENFKKMLDVTIKKVKLNVTPGFHQVLYGDIFLVGQLTKSGTAAWYSPQEDTIYCRIAKEKWGFTEAHSLIHELGHRYYRKFADKSSKVAWSLHHDRVGAKDVEVPMPEVGDPLPLRLRGAPRGWRPVVKSRDKTNYTFERPDGSEGKVLVFNIWKVQQQNHAAALRFPTPYSSKNEEEHFCEALALLSMGGLSEEHAIPFRTIWSK